MDIAYRRLALTDESIIECSRFLNKVFIRNKPKTPAFLKWEYLDNPTGKAVGYNAYSEDQLIAHFVAQPIVSMINGEPKRGLLALHVGTDPVFRGRGLFYEVNKRTLDLAMDEGYDFMIGIGNKHSTPLYQGKLGFRLICSLNTLISFGLPSIAHPGNDPSQYSRIWDQESLKWRLSHPDNQYKAHTGKNRTAILGNTNLRFMKVLMKSIANDGPHATMNLPRSKYPRLYVWYGLGSELVWNSIPRFPLPDRFKPSPLNLIFRFIRGKELSFDPKRIILNPIDHDAF